MKRLHLLLGCAAVCLLALALSSIRIDPAVADCAIPENPDWVWWENSQIYPATVRAYNAGGEFSSNQKFQWCYTTTPFMGAVETVTESTENITGEEYSPLYFFPASKSGSVVITWTGSLIDSDEPGTLVALGWCYPPYKTATRTLTVKCYSTQSCP